MCKEGGAAYKTYKTISSKILETPYLDVPITIRDQETSQVVLETS